jgi:hypothetical protein
LTMKMKNLTISVIVSIMLFLLLLSGCSSLLDSMVSEASKPPAKAVSNDPLDGYVFAYVEGRPGDYHVAKILKPASSETKNQAEVLDMYSNEKRYAKVFTSHPAGNSELTVGQLVLVQGSGFSDPDKDTLIATSWEASYVTDASDLFKGEVKVGGATYLAKHVRIPDTEVTSR